MAKIYIYEGDQSPIKKGPYSPINSQRFEISKGTQFAVVPDKGMFSIYTKQRSHSYDYQLCMNLNHKDLARLLKYSQVYEPKIGERDQTKVKKLTTAVITELDAVSIKASKVFFKSKDSLHFNRTLHRIRPVLYKAMHDISSGIVAKTFRDIIEIASITKPISEIKRLVTNIKSIIKKKESVIEAYCAAHLEFSKIFRYIEASDIQTASDIFELGGRIQDGFLCDGIKFYGPSLNIKRKLNIVSIDGIKFDLYEGTKCIASSTIKDVIDIIR